MPVARLAAALGPSVAARLGLALALFAGGCAPSAVEAWRARDRRAKVDPEPAIEASAQRVVVRGATVMTAEGPSFAPGWVAWADGRITGVGEGAPPETVLDGASVVDASGRFVTPGIIDAHSHLGVYASPRAKAHADGNEMVQPTTPGVWAEHAFWPQDPGLQRAVAGGVTTLHALPGSGNLIGGRGVTLHLSPRRGSRAMRFPGAPDSLKMACGENPKRVYGEKGRAPMTRMGNIAGQRAAFEAAKRGRAGDLEVETLTGVLHGEILLQVHCYRADEMLHVLAMADELGFRVRSFHHAVEAYKIRDVLKARDVSISTWADWWGFKLEAWDAVLENASLLSEAGVRAVIHSDSARGIRRLNQEAAKAYYAGQRSGIELEEHEALRWITANPAWTLGIEDEVGTLSPGKRADLVIWDAHPLSVYARAEWVVVDGALIFDRHRPGEPWSDFEAAQEVTP